MKCFYKREDVVTARDLLYDRLPAVEGAARRVKHRKSEDDLVSMHDVLQEMNTENPLLFASVDLNNIPCVDLKNIDGVSLLSKQSDLESKVQEMIQQQAAMKTQLIQITRFLENEKIHSSTQKNNDDPSTYANIVARDNNHREDTGNVNVSSQQTTTPASQLLSTSPNETELEEFLNERRLQSNKGFRSNKPPNVANEYAEHSSINKDIRLSKNYVQDSEGFIRQEKKPRRAQRPLTMGRKSGTRIKVAPVVKECKIFVSRLAPDFPVEELQEFIKELTGDDSTEITTLKTKFPTYSSFVITCNKQHETILLDPDEWEEGVLIRPFVGNLVRRNSTTLSDRDSRS